MNKPLGLAHAYEWALKHRGRCLADSYRDSRTKMPWECSEGHRWQAPLCRVKAGHWCAVCAGNKELTVADLRASAKACDSLGVCLSRVYLGKNAKHLWRCGKGHIWEAVPRTIRSGHWCPECGHEVSKAGVMRYFSKTRQAGK